MYTISPTDLFVLKIETCLYRSNRKHLNDFSDLPIIKSKEDYISNRIF